MVDLEEIQERVFILSIHINKLEKRKPIVTVRNYWFYQMEVDTGALDQEIENKFILDLEGVKKNGVNGIAFVTNQELRLAERKDLSEIDATIILKNEVMKTDRLYTVTLYLLNHGKSSASELAKHFEYRCGRFRGKGNPNTLDGE